MKLILSLALFFGFVVMHPIPVYAKPVKVTSDNFVFIGNVRVSEAKSLVAELEAYRYAILKLLGKNLRPEAIPVRIYSVKNGAELQEITGHVNIGGVYKSTFDGPIFIVNSAGGFGKDKKAQKTALHEYTHHVLATYTDIFYPRWYNEGLANYFSTFKVGNNGQFIFGLPDRPFDKILRKKTWMTTEIVVNSIKHYPFKHYGNKNGGLGSSDFFYAQSWLAVHYLRSTPDEAANIRKYLALMNMYTRPEDAFARAFKRTPQEFHKQLRAYSKARKFQVIHMNPNYAATQKPLVVSRLDYGLAQFHKAEAMRLFSGAGVETENIETEYDKASMALASSNRKRADILAARVDLALRGNHYSKAQELITRALAISPKNAVVNRSAGMVYMSINEAGDITPNKIDMELARGYFKSAILINPDDMRAHYQYVKSYALVNEQPSDQALISAEMTLNYYRNLKFVESNLMLAKVLVHGEKYELAREALDRALVWSRSMGVRPAARHMLKKIDQLQNHKLRNQ